MPPQPLHFIFRTTTPTTAPGQRPPPGPIVPLIPIDLLPPWLEIVGVPRELTVEETIGMSNLGGYPREEEDFQVIVHHIDGKTVAATAAVADAAGSTADAAASTAATTTITTTTAATTTPDPSGGQPSTTKVNEPECEPGEKSPAGEISLAPSAKTKTKRGKTATGGHASASTGAKTKPKPFNSKAHNTTTTTTTTTNTHPNGNRKTQYAPSTNSRASAPRDRPSKPKAPQTIYCRHWCQYGTCRWGPHCWYEHSMPGTVEGLAEVGLREFPPWWQSAMGFSLSQQYGGGVAGQFMPGMMHGYGPGYGQGYGQGSHAMAMPSQVYHPGAGPSSGPGWGGSIGWSGREQNEYCDGTIQHFGMSKGREENDEIERMDGNLLDY